METSVGYGLIVVLIGISEILITPAILKRYKAMMKPGMYDYVVKMTRISGLIVVAFGLLLMSGFLTGRIPA